MQRAGAGDQWTLCGRPIADALLNSLGQIGLLVILCCHLEILLLGPGARGVFGARARVSGARPCVFRALAPIFSATTKPRHICPQVGNVAAALFNSLSGAIGLLIILLCELEVLLLGPVSARVVSTLPRVFGAVLGVDGALAPVIKGITKA